MPPRTWTCQRVTAGVKCGAVNPKRRLICEACGKRRPASKRPAHRVALDAFTYEDYVALNGGDFCALCKTPRADRRLDRDHDHETGRPRGLLCHRCNRFLPRWMTPVWLRSAAAYLERASERRAA